jgi:hypothetical protein
MIAKSTFSWTFESDSFCDLKCRSWVEKLAMASADSPRSSPTALCAGAASLHARIKIKVQMETINARFIFLPDLIIRFSSPDNRLY